MLVEMGCTAISGFARRLRRINAEAQRFAEERRERRKKMVFSSALLCALCVSALKLVRLRLRLGRAALFVVGPLLFSSRDAICQWALFRFCPVENLERPQLGHLRYYALSMRWVRARFKARRRCEKWPDCESTFDWSYSAYGNAVVRTGRA